MFCLSLMLVCAAEAAEPSLRPPSVPLVAHDPYFSLWLPADRLTDADAVHWTGRSQPLRCLLRLDGQTYRLLGAQPADVPPLPQTSLRVTPTRTLAGFANQVVAVDLTFLTPSLPAELDVLARPVTYLRVDLRSVDGQSHDVQLLVELGAELAANEGSEPVSVERPTVPGLEAARLGHVAQPVLGRSGDDLRIDWGYAWLGAQSSSHPALYAGLRAGLLTSFAESGQTPVVTRFAQPQPASAVSMALVWDLGLVGELAVSRTALVAYDDVWSVRYGNEDLRPYWRRGGAEMPTMLAAAARDERRLARACADFDQRLEADLTAVGGRQYAQLCALAYRQTLAGNKLCADARGSALLLPKENFSNGCIGTVDVLFPQAPFFLLFSPSLAQAMLEPVLAYAASPSWPYAYAPHDLGTYPWATGQVYGLGRPGADGDGDRMPVEECGNMLLMVAATSQCLGQVRWLDRYWPLLEGWATYLRDHGLDPANQLSSADMFGHLPHSASLALKATLALGAWARLCEQRGLTNEAAGWWAVARDFATRWQALATAEGRTRLAYNLPDSWGQKHNLPWERLLGLTLLPADLAERELAWYARQVGAYGLPVDSRTRQGLIDWNLWSISLADAASFRALVQPLWRYANETPDRVPLSDWYDVDTGRLVGFRARPVVGGLFMRLLLDAPRAERWRRASAVVPNRGIVWHVPQPPHAWLADARSAATPWRYTTQPPATAWIEPGFDDSGWARGAAGFGHADTPGAHVRTEWLSPDIWLRTRFELSEVPAGRLIWTLHHDEDTAIYLNGRLVDRVSGWTTGYGERPLSQAAREALAVGTNTLAVHCHQTTGGQYIDLGLAER